MAAFQAAARGRRTVLLEKNQRPGLKILISGGGRCNLTTTREGPDLEAQYGKRRGRFLRHALRSFPPAALRAFIEDAGVPLREEDLEKLFPVSQKAKDAAESRGQVPQACKELLDEALIAAEALIKESQAMQKKLRQSPSTQMSENRLSERPTPMGGNITKKRHVAGMPENSNLRRRVGWREHSQNYSPRYPTSDSLVDQYTK